MRIDIMTLFPEMCETVLGESILGRARENKLVDIHCHDIRAYTIDKHRRVDDYPYGGGMGMVMQAQPIYDCFEAIVRAAGSRPHLIYLSPQGGVFRQRRAVELASMSHIALLCGHYEGVDERVLEELVDCLLYTSSPSSSTLSTTKLMAFQRSFRTESLVAF